MRTILSVSLSHWAICTKVKASLFRYKIAYWWVFDSNFTWYTHGCKGMTIKYALWEQKRFLHSKLPISCGSSDNFTIFISVMFKEAFLLYFQDINVQFISKMQWRNKDEEGKSVIVSFYRSLIKISPISNLVLYRMICWTTSVYLFLRFLIQSQNWVRLENLLKIMFCLCLKV